MSELTDYTSDIEIEDFSLEGYEPEPETIVPPSGWYLCTIPTAKMLPAVEGKAPAGIMLFKIKEIVEVLEKTEPAPEAGSQVLIYSQFDTEYRSLVERHMRIMFDLLGSEIMTKSAKTNFDNIQRLYENRTVKVKFRRDPEKNPPRTTDGQLLGELRYFARLEKVVPTQPPTTDDIPF